jgi:hypothetical protein
MSASRLATFLQMVKTANKDFTESRSCLRPLLASMRQQVASNNFNLSALGPHIASARKDSRGGEV